MTPFSASIREFVSLMSERSIDWVTLSAVVGLFTGILVRLVRGKKNR
jgi:hypothetical protein